MILEWDYGVLLSTLLVILEWDYGVVLSTPPINFLVMTPKLAQN